ncbi:hypothetical protein G5V59_17640 [Nocardioides sp. W3-2-3]|nr:hypothetical protein [Nocardioides convexus]
MSTRLRADGQVVHLARTAVPVGDPAHRDPVAGAVAGVAGEGVLAGPSRGQHHVQVRARRPRRQARTLDRLQVQRHHVVGLGVHRRDPDPDAAVHRTHLGTPSGGHRHQPHDTLGEVPEEAVADGVRERRPLLDGHRPSAARAAGEVAR